MEVHLWKYSSVAHDSNEIDANSLREFAKKRPIWDFADITQEQYNGIFKDAKSSLIIRCYKEICEKFTGKSVFFSIFFTQFRFISQK